MRARLGILGKHRGDRVACGVTAAAVARGGKPGRGGAGRGGLGQRRRETSLEPSEAVRPEPVQPLASVGEDQPQRRGDAAARRMGATRAHQRVGGGLAHGRARRDQSGEQRGGARDRGGGGAAREAGRGERVGCRRQRVRDELEREAAHVGGRRAVLGGQDRRVGPVREDAVEVPATRAPRPQVSTQRSAPRGQRARARAHAVESHTGFQCHKVRGGASGVTR